MKILYVGHTYTVRANQAKIASLARIPDVEIVLVTPHAWRGPLYENRTDPFDSATTPNVQHHILRSAFIGKESAYLYNPAIFKLIKDFQPDIVHVEQGAYALSYAQILWGLKRYSPRSHSLFFTWWNLPYELRGIKHRAERFNLSLSASAIAGNQASKDILRERGFHRPIHVLPQLGVDVSMFQGNPRRTNGTFRIGYAGRITKEKGVLDLVDAVARMENKERSELYFVGAGGELENVKRTAGANSVSLSCHPPVRNDVLSEHLSKMDVLVLPSRSTTEWVEQFGHILLEAMAAGVPVIGSSSGEIPHVIGNAGIIFNEGNSAELAADLDRLFGDPNERSSLMELGMQRVTEHFTHDRIAHAQKDIYDWLLAEGDSVGSLSAKKIS